MTEDNLQELKLKIKKYLELENVSVLAGAGSSFHLGTPIIREIPEELRQKLTSEIKNYFSTNAVCSYEDLFNCLQADRFIKEKKQEDTSEIDKKINLMQNWLFEHCDTEKATIHKSYENDEHLKNNRYFYHEMLIKKLLQRPNNLRRANLFTTNYDMAFDYALDNLGVHYINGFMGVHNRFFRPEVYDYDIYYPGQSISGKVHRAEKVLRYYKIHGSLSWASAPATAANTYGIKEIALHDNFEVSTDNQLIIYPCVNKKTFTLDLPYSELFRQFSQAIHRSQSVLICLGYSFNDEHVNDIIYQALSNPSFTLIIANYNSNGDEEKIKRLKELNDSRIHVIESTNSEQSSFIGFVKNVMPDLYEEEEREVIKSTMEKLYPKKSHEDIEDASE